MRKTERGSVIILALVIIALIAIAILPMVRRLHINTRQSVDVNTSEKARQLARTGLDHGLWYLTSGGTGGNSPYKQVMAGNEITEYKGDKEYSNQLLIHEAGAGALRDTGRYIIDFSSGPDRHQISIRVLATPSNRVRATKVTAIYDDMSVGSALYVEKGTIASDGSDVSISSLPASMPIHWGPVRALKGIRVINDNTSRFPRKISGKRVINRDTGSGYSPNSDDKEYWANSTDIYLPPDYDLGYMRYQAQNSVLYSGQPTLVTGSSTPARMYLNTDAVWYYDGDLTISGPFFLRGILIVTGNLTIERTATGLNSGFEMNNTPIPSDAKKEYTKHLELFGGCYPPGSAYNTNPNAVTHNFAANTVGFRGFIYVGKSLISKKIAGDPAFYIYGSVFVKESVGFEQGANFGIYYGDYKNDQLPWPEIRQPTLQMTNKNEEVVMSPPVGGGF